MPDKRGGRPPIDMTGRTYGLLTVIGRAAIVEGKITWNCKCNCGNTVICDGRLLRRGKVESCGCRQSDVASELAATRRKAARQRRRQLEANLASLNEVLAEMAAQFGDASFGSTVRDTLRDHSWALGFEFQGERAPEDWTPPWEQ